MSNWSQVKDGGKGSKKRAGANDQKYRDNWDRIFGSKSPKDTIGNRK